MQRKRLVLAITAGLAASSSPMVWAAPSTNCPAASGNVITVASGTTVVATETNGCTLATGESIVVESGGAIDFDQPSFNAGFGVSTDVAGIFVPESVAAVSIDVAGIVSIGGVNDRAGIRVLGGGSVSGDITVSGTVEVQMEESSSSVAVFATGAVGGKITVSGTVDAVGGGGIRAGIATGGSAATTDVVVEAAGVVRGEVSAITLFGAPGGAVMANLTNAGDILPSALSETPVGGGIELTLQKSLTTLNNQAGAKIQAGTGAFFPVHAVNVNTGSTIGTLENSGEIEAFGGGSGVHVAGGSQITTLTNNASGTIVGSDPEVSDSSISALDGIDLTGSISTLNNLGTITGADAAIDMRIDDNPYFFFAGRIDSLVNLGTLTGGATTEVPANPSAPAIKTWVGDEGTAAIGRLVNKQAGLRYSGGLPTNYDVVITDASTYGSIIFDNAEGVMAFGIDVERSTVTNNTLYSGVLDGVTAEQLSATSGTSGAFNWTLTSDGDATEWDLCVGDCTLSPEPDAKPIPVMGLWGAWLLAGLSGLLGLMGIRRQRRA